MAVRPLEVKIDADVKGAVRGLDTLAESLDDVIEELDDLADEGDDTARELAQDFRKIERAADEAGDKVKRHLGEGFDEAKDEALQSGREAAASFSGGFDDVADFVQETLANALGGFGPIGAAAGIAIATGLGAALQGLADRQERLEEVRDAAAELAQTLYENKGAIPITEQIDHLFEVLSKERKALGLESLIDQWADFGTTLDSIQRGAEAADIDVRDILRTMGGRDGRAARDLLAAVNKRLDELYADRQKHSHGLFPDIQPLETLRGELQNVITIAEVADQMMGAVGSAYENSSYLAKIEEIGDAWNNAAVDASDYFTETEEGATEFDWSTYLADAEKTIAAADELKRRIVTLPQDIRDEADRVFATQGAVAANEYTKAYERASAADKGRFEQAARANGEAAARSQAKGFEAAWRSPEATVKVLVDDSAWKKWTPDRKTAQLAVKITGKPVATWE